MKSMLKHTLPFVLSALALGCDDADPIPSFMPSQAPASLEDALIYTGSAGTESRAIVLDVATAHPVTHRYALPKGTVRMLPMPGSSGRQVLVFTSGVAASTKHQKRVAAEPAALTLFDRTGPIAQLTLSNRYDSLDLSDDGKFGIAYAAAGNLVLQNFVEVINFDKLRAHDPQDPANAVMDFSFDGRTPAGFVFAPPGFVHRLALAPLANSLQVIDLDHPERGEIAIKLSTSTTLVPQKLVFTDDQIFVQNQGSSQILSFQVIEQPRSADAAQPFQFAPSANDAGGSVEDLSTVGSADSLRLVALAGNLEVIDPAVDTSVSVAGVASFSQLYEFVGKSPTDSNALPRAALYGKNVSQLGFVDLGNETAWSTSNVELIELGDALQDFRPIAGTNLALVTHATARISLVDLENRTVKRVLLDSASQGTLLDQSGSKLRLWVAGSDGSLGNIDLATLLPTEVPLTFTYAGPNDGVSTSAQSLLLVPGPAPAPGVAPTERIAVLESSDVGRVTLLDANTPTPDSALEVVGFFLDGLFE